MVYSSVAEERQHALQLGRALNSRPVSGKTCRMVVTGEAGSRRCWPEADLAIAMQQLPERPLRNHLIPVIMDCALYSASRVVARLFSLRRGCRRLLWARDRIWRRRL
jgi:hypothetical protein